jgi:hypothetical protein
MTEDRTTLSDDEILTTTPGDTRMHQETDADGSDDSDGTDTTDSDTDDTDSDSDGTDT